MIADKIRFWGPVIVLLAICGNSTYRLVSTHLNSEIAEPRYDFTRPVPPRRGTIYDATRESDGGHHVLVESTPSWEYRLDPVAMTNELARSAGTRHPLTQAEMVSAVSDCLGLDYDKVLAMTQNTSNRYQLLGISSDGAVHAVMTNTAKVVGVRPVPTYERHYYEGARFSHILGSVNAENDGSCGLEQRFNRDLKGIPGSESGKMDANHRVLWDKKVETTPAVNGADIYLTVNHNLQYMADLALADGIRLYGAEAGWCVVLDVRTGEVLAMSSHPDFEPEEFGRAPDAAKVNRVTSFTYEPGSVMKVITAAAAIDAGVVGPESLYSSARHDERYYKLPGDGHHVWPERLSVREAIVKSSNIVIGKLGYDLGPKRLYAAMTRFGFGRKTGIELPGEEVGILRDPNKRMWDKATWSRAPIGQGVSVTAIQMASAYQTIANDGVRLAPRIVKRILDDKGSDILDPATRVPPEGERVISKRTARIMRDVMLGVTTKDGTARRAAIRGYSVAGKTGTAQKVKNGKYAPGLYRASFCGIVPSGVVKRDPTDREPAEARFVILVTLDFEKNVKFHQGGNSAGVIFARIARSALRQYNVEPDRPDEVADLTEAEFNVEIQKSSERYLMETDPDWDGDPNCMAD